MLSVLYGAMYDRTADSLLKSHAMHCDKCVLNFMEEPATSVFTAREARLYIPPKCSNLCAELYGITT